MLFHLVLLYIVVFYSQIGERIPALESVRLEFVIGGVILGIILMKRLTGRPHDHTPDRLNFAIILFLASIVISIPGSYWLSNSANTFLRLLKSAAIYVMIVSTIDTEARLRKVLWIYLLMVFLIVGQPFWGMFTGSAKFETHRGYPKLLGVTGLWMHPNSLGGFAASNLAFLYFLYNGEKSLPKRMLILLIAVSSLGTIVYTGSRTAYVGLLGVAFCVWLGARRKLRTVLLVSFCLIALWITTPPQYKQQFLTLQEAPHVVRDDANIDSMATRWQIIKDAWTIFLDHPILGVGIDAFMTVRGMRFDRWQDTHNLYLQVLTNLGIVGGFAFVLVLYHIFKNLRLAERLIVQCPAAERQWLHMAARAMTVFLVARLIVGMFGMDLYENYWWLAGGLSVAVLRIARKPLVAQRGRPARREPIVLQTAKDPTRR